MALNQIILNGFRFCSITFDLLLRHDSHQTLQEVKVVFRFID